MAPDSKTIPPCPFPKKFPSQLQRDDAFFMQLAYNQAIEAWNNSEVPIGAVITVEGQVIASAFNQVESTRDPTAHAEILAITQASNALEDWRLNQAVLYVTKEPCPMCSGATVMARLSRVVFALPDPKMGCLGGSRDLSNIPAFNHRLAITPGVLEDDCRQLIQAFFRLRRNTDSESPDPSEPDKSPRNR